jgi:hypothetical protein
MKQRLQLIALAPSDNHGNVIILNSPLVTPLTTLSQFVRVVLLMVLDNQFAVTLPKSRATRARVRAVPELTPA